MILQTSDTHSRIEPIAVNAADRYAGMGGTVRRATFIKEARKVNPDLLLFDCGDISQELLTIICSRRSRSQDDEPYGLRCHDDW